MSDIVSADQRHLFNVINNVILCGFVCQFGIVTNIINLIIFYRKVLNTTTNISFISVAVSDLYSHLLQHWYILWVNPLFVNSQVPMIYSTSLQENREKSLLDLPAQSLSTSR